MTKLLRISVMLSICFPAGLVQGEEKINFEDHVKPIFRSRCFSCHNTNKKTADLDLSNYTAVMQGGGSGASIEPGSPDDSYLFMVVNHDTEPYMPPNSDRIPDPEIQTLRKWIEGGAPETASSKVTLPDKPRVDLSVEVLAGSRPEGPPPRPDILNLEPVVATAVTTAVSAIATSPWAKLAAVAGQKQIVLYDTQTLQPLGILPFPEGQARVLKFSRSGSLLLAGGGHGAAKGLVVVWDIRSGRRMVQVGDELDEVLAADISADQSLIALGGPGRIVRVYHTATGKLAWEVAKHTDWVTALEFSTDGALLATGDRASGLHVWEAPTGREHLTLTGHKGAITSISWRLDGKVVASGSEDTSVKLWEVEEGKNIKSWNAHGSGTLSLEYCRDGHVVTCGRDRVTKYWDANGKQLRAFEAFGDLALQVSFCDETNRVIAGDWTGEIRVWNAADGKRVGNLSPNPPLLATRLQQTEAKLVAARNAHQASTAALQAADTAHTAHTQKIATAKTADAKLQQALTAVETQQATLETQLAQLDSELSAGRKRLTALQQALPGLSAAHKKAEEAVAVAVNDPELKTVATRLKAQVTARQAEVRSTTDGLTQKQNNRNSVAQSLQQSRKQRETTRKQRQEKARQLQQLVTALKPFADKQSAARQAAGQTQGTIDALSADVARWQNYTALRDELKALEVTEQRRDEAQLHLLQAKAVWQEKQAEIDAAQQQLTQATAAIAQAGQDIQQQQAVITSATEQTKQLTAQKQQLDKVLPLLKEALKQAQSAASVLPGDAEIRQSVTSIEKTVGTRTQQISTLTQQLTTAQQTITTSQKTIDARQATLNQSKTQQEASTKMLTTLKGQLAPLEQTVTKAEQTLAAVESEVTSATAVVEQRRAKLRPPQNVAQSTP